MVEDFIDEDLGLIVIVRNSRARRLIARRKSNAIQLTVPEGISLDKVKLLLRDLKPRLLDLKPVSSLFFDESTNLTTLTFSLNIKKNNTQSYYVSLNDGVLNIICPKSCDFTEDTVQQKIRTYIENIIRKEAKRILPLKLDMLSKQFGFKYTDIKINKSRTRWGSCSARKSINLSIFCMFLPEPLLDFIILHELCHTVEMNHGDRFWALLDKVTNNQAKALTKQLKTIKINW